MRLILIVQSLIILAGAYYLFTLRHDAGQSGVDKPLPSVYEVVEQESETNSELDDSTPTTTSDEKAGVNIGNDRGMEYPTFDGELEVR